MSREAIYTEIVRLARLEEHHKTELIEKRGFSDRTIAEQQFKSSGSYFKSIEESLRAAFKEEELITSGVFVFDGRQAGLNGMFLEERILIPYWSAKDEVYHLRFCVPAPLRNPKLPKIFGLANIAIEVFQERNIHDNPSEIILTEGEFKAVAGQQYGVPSLGLPGISSFSEVHFPRLEKLIDDFKVKKVTLIFDNEIKNDPALAERYKPNPMTRYDTEFYAYYMAKKLEERGKEVRIAWLPDSWRVNGKIDLDGAAAQGRTSGDLRAVMYLGKTQREYLKELEGEARQVLLRKNTQKRHSSNIYKDFNHYVAMRRRGQKEWPEIISNFVIKIIATHETPEGIVREVVFTNEYDETSSAFSLPPDCMAGADSFATFCLGRGNYIWKGSKEDLAVIWESEFLMDDGRHITEPDHIGWIEKDKIWLFGNIAIKEDGSELRPDKNHVFWFEKKGLKPIPLGVTTGKTMISEGIPYLSLNAIDVKEIRMRLGESIGDMEASMCLGWISAIPFLEEVFDHYGSYPFLFITGKRGSGKSTIAEWLMNFFGLENAGKMAADTTQVGVQRYLSYYSSLPVFLDEYRNTKQVTSKNGFFRNAYNRQSAGKGIKADFGLREAKIRGTLLIAGEETPEDNALLTRCIVVLVSARSRVKNHFGWFMANRIKFSNHLLTLLRNKKSLLKRFLEVLQEGKDFFTEAGADDRIAINYATIAAGYAIAFGENGTADIGFARWLSQETQRVRDEYMDEQAVSIFYEDLVAMKTRGLIDGKYWDVNEGKIYLYFHGLYSLWSQEYRKTRGIEPFKAASIRDYLREEEGFLEPSKVWRISGQMKKCAVFDYAKAPDLVRALVESVTAP